MKHYFIINPIAGYRNQTEDITKEVQSIFERINKERDIKNQPHETYEIYVTKEVGDSERQANIASKNLTEDTIFYACGGDGTCYEVVNGIYGRPHAFFGVIPIGSCNDLLKPFPDINFRNINNLVKGTLKPIDILKTNNRYSINVVNIGFDARVNDDCNKMKKQMKSVKSAYNRAIIKNLLRPLSREIKIMADDKEVFNGKMLLMACANGQYYGGGYRCAPKAKIDDNLLDLVTIKGVSRLTFVRLVKSYKAGLHLDNPHFTKIITFQKAHHVIISANEPLCVCLDGETFFWKNIDIEVMHNEFMMIVPNKE